MLRVRSASDQAWASAIWPTAAAAWLLLQLQLALGKAEAAAPQCDGARRDDDDLGTADAQVGKIIDQRRQP